MSKTLVAFFSASGVTKKVAQKVAAVTGGDLFEILPEVPYSSADLNWQDKNSRSSVEMNDKAFRPAIASSCKVEDMASYDKIIVGFPVWWYVAPTIINTFLEQYDLKGKKLAFFATSGSSGMGNSSKELMPSAPGAECVGEKRFASDVTEEEIKKWTDSL